VRSSARQALVVLRKEVVDNLRDRRSVLTACLTPLVGVLVMGLGATFVSKKMAEATRRPLTLPVVGMDRAPDLMAFLGEHGVRPAAEAGSPSERVRSGDAPVAPEPYGAALRAGKPAPLQLISDRSQATSSAQVARLESLLGQYSLRLGSLRLVARGVDARIVQAVALERVDLSTPQSRSTMVLRMVPLILVLSLLLGGMGVPLLSEEVLISRLVRGEEVQPLHLVVALAAGAAWAALAIAGTIHLYRSERVLFGTSS